MFQYEVGMYEEEEEKLWTWIQMARLGTEIRRNGMGWDLGFNPSAAQSEAQARSSKLVVGKAKMSEK